MAPTNSDTVECPRCNSPLIRRNAPFYLHHERVGTFESLVCEMCHFSALTSQGYQEATKEAENFGLIGPAEQISNKVKILAESVGKIQSQFSVQNLVVGNFIGHHEWVKTGEKTRKTAMTGETEMPEQEYYAQYSDDAPIKFEIPVADQN